MADQTTSNIGHDSKLAPGASMHGVTGREPVLSLASKADVVDSGAGKFPLPVDTLHKAKTIRLFSIAQPHMRAFHLSWLAFFTSFLSTFAAAPLLPIIREDLNLTKPEVANAGIAAVTGTIASRIAMGAICDMVGPRYGISFLMLLTAVPVFCMSLVQSYGGFITARLFIGFGLATFVATQYWASTMFSSRIVGMANATTAGWGNAGGGFTQLIMPLIFRLIAAINGNDFVAWRIAFFVPGVAHVLLGMAVLMFSQDLPDGTFAQLIKKGEKAIDKPKGVFLIGLRNYRMWCLVATYAFCFGVELTVDNVAATYFYDRFDVNLEVSGVIASCVGMANIFARPLGGITSDLMARKFGMRGRLWTLWTVQTIAGVLAIVLGRMNSLWSSVLLYVIFGIFIDASCGCTYGIVPFISRRALGIVSGFIGAGGNAGGALNQAIWFQNTDRFAEEDGITYMGIAMVGVTLLIIPISFPQWGSMFFGPSSKGVTEEDYYASEWTEEEVKQNKHKDSMLFAETARKSERPRAERDQLVELEAPTVKAHAVIAA
eukprot:jgi/Chlat1/3763/Chrsp259S03905